MRLETKGSTLAEIHPFRHVCSGRIVSQRILVKPDVSDFNSVVAVGIVRLKVLLDINAVSPDITWSLWPSQLWTAIELNVAVVSGKSRISSSLLRPTNQAAFLAVLIAFHYLERALEP